MDAVHEEPAAPSPRRRPLPPGLIALIAATLLGVDQLTKWLVVTNLQRGDVIPVAGILKLRYTYNTGVAFGLWSSGGRFLPVLAALCILVLLFWGSRYARHSATIGWALAFVVGGALGNMVDRIRLGHVVDFIDFTVWPTFNFADTCVVSGALLLLIHSLFFHEAPRREPAITDDRKASD